MPTLYLMQTFNDMGYYKDNGANVEFTYYSVYSDAISAYGTGNVDGNYLCGRRGCYTCCKRNWQQSNRCYRYFTYGIMVNQLVGFMCLKFVFYGLSLITSF